MTAFLNPRLIATQGFALTPIALAVQGLLEVANAEQPQRPPSIPGGGFGTAISSGPDALLSMADFLRRFGPSAAAAEPEATHNDNGAVRCAKIVKRQRMEEETLLLWADILE